MPLTLLGVRLALAAVFGVAGVAKLVDRAGSRTTLLAFGVPARMVGPATLALPLAELITALALLPAASAWWAAWAALGLLTLFSAAIGVNLAQGRRPACHCFGQIASGPVGGTTLARNAGLALLAALLVWRGPGQLGPDAWSGWRAEVALLLVALGTLALLGWGLVQLARQHGRLLLRIEALESGSLQVPAATAPAHGLMLGAPAPDFNLPGLDGQRITLAQLLAGGRPAALLFIDPACGPCAALLPVVARWHQQHSGQLNLALVSSGAAKRNTVALAGHALPWVGLQHDREVATAYGATATPSAVLISPHGQVASRVAAGSEAIMALLDGVVANPEAGLAGQLGGGQALGVGSPVPDLALPDPTGRLVTLFSPDRNATLLLFWNPACGHCARMHDDLAAWAHDRPAGSPTLLIVSSTPADNLHALGPHAQVLLDPEFRVGQTFGAQSTPSAVLVDERGRVASDLAVGAGDIFALAHRVAPSTPALPVGG